VKADGVGVTKDVTTLYGMGLLNPNAYLS
jgi:hypothetical protein